MEQQIIAAVGIASDPNQNRELQAQALEFLNNVRENHAQTWNTALQLFVQVNQDRSRTQSPQVRFFCLHVLDDLLANRPQDLDHDSFQLLRQAVIEYIQSEFVFGPAEATAPFLRNKFSHTVSLLFLCTYENLWPDFFSSLFTLLRPPGSDTLNTHVSNLLLRLLMEISGEVADKTLLSARGFIPNRGQRDGKVRDLIRDRDAPAINEVVLTIISEGKKRMDAGEHMEEVVDLGLRAFASYIPWIDINLTVTPSTIQLLFSILSASSLPIRLATCLALSSMVTKGLKEGADKLRLFNVLSLGNVLGTLEERTRSPDGTERDEVEESFREALGRLTNLFGLELVKLCDDTNQTEEIRSGASALLSPLIPIMQRFLADAYDDTSQTVFPLLNSLLSVHKRAKKAAPTDPLNPDAEQFLASTLEILLQKLKWDGDDDPDDMDEDDLASFSEMRKDLRVSIDSILTLNNDLVIGAISGLAHRTLSAYEGGEQIKWEDAELAVYLVSVFGELKTNVPQGKGRLAFCYAPVKKSKDERRGMDYSEYPLTPLGEMLQAMVRSGISTYPHPAVAMQFFETAARYPDFFKVRKEYILPVLEALIDARGIHHPKSSVRQRVFYLFHRFVRESRKDDIPIQLIPTLLNAMSDLLTIVVELPEVDSDTEDLLTKATLEASPFDSQLYLFETAGTLISALFPNPEQQAALLTAITTPLMAEMRAALGTPMNGPQDVAPVLKVHHVVMALGSVVKGFPEIPSPMPPEWVAPPVNLFRETAEAILVALGAMNRYKLVRDAARFAFARIMTTCGSSMADFMPRLTASLLAHFEPTELVAFMTFLAHMVHKLNNDIFDVLDQLILPLTTHISALLAQPITGTDDKVAYLETKKAYLTFLNNIMVAKLHSVFISSRNASQFQTVLDLIVQMTLDLTDTSSQKMALTFLSKVTAIFGAVAGVPSPTLNGLAPPTPEPIQGFERFLFESVIPVLFKVPLLPEFNTKDGQAMLVLFDIAALLQQICKTRGQEAYDFMLTAFLPAQNCPPETALSLVTNIQSMDTKTFKKYFTDFVRALREGG